MAAKRRPAPSFRPNLKLSHFVYQGPEERHYDLHGKVAKEATGQAVRPDVTADAEAGPSFNQGRRDGES
jgi:hypothetical protein